VKIEQDRRKKTEVKAIAYVPMQPTDEITYMIHAQLVLDDAISLIQI
jgi:hypothetical protein